MARFSGPCLFCSGDSLQELCPRCNIEIGFGSFCARFMTNEFKPAEFHATCCGDKIFVPVQRTFFSKKGMLHEENCRRSTSPVHVSATCLLVRASHTPCKHCWPADLLQRLTRALRMPVFMAQGFQTCA